MTRNNKHTLSNWPLSRILDLTVSFDACTPSKKLRTFAEFYDEDEDDARDYARDNHLVLVDEILELAHTMLDVATILDDEQLGIWMDSLEDEMYELETRMETEVAL